MVARPLLAIFVGGKSRRMGEPKGLLPVPGGVEPIVEALVRRAREAGLRSVCSSERRLPTRILPRGCRGSTTTPPAPALLRGSTPLFATP